MSASPLLKEVPVTSPRPLPQAFDMQGRVVVITGGAGLLGREHAAALAECGATPVLLDLNLEGAEKVAWELSERHQTGAYGLNVDVTSPESCQQALQQVLARSGQVDVLVNNAALNPKVEGEGLSRTRFENLDLAFWNRDIAVGLTGAFLMSQVFGAEMARRGKGVIVNVASDLGLIAPDQRIYEQEGLGPDEQPAKPVSYSVVKGGLVMLTKYLATYYAKAGVRVNAICPGGVYAGQPSDFVERLTQLIPMGRMAEASEYRSALAFLCSDASSYMTGSNLVIDGGRTCW